MAGDFESRLDRQIEICAERHTRLLQELLAIPTPRMKEHAAVRFIAEKLRQAGLAVDVFEGEALGELAPDGPPLNIRAQRSGAGGGRSLLLGAHLDTVPSGDPRRWQHGPWSARIENGRIYARGAHDDRTGAALIAALADLLAALEVRTRGDLHVLITTEEEFSSGGMKAYLKRPDRVHPDAYLMVDGNDVDECIVGHPAAANFEIRIEGAFGSAQDPAIVHEANAIELMGPVVIALRSFEAEMRRRQSDNGADPRWPPPTVAVTEIRSSGWISNAPEECVLRGFCNVIPPLSLTEYQAAFESAVQQTASRSKWLCHHPLVISWGPLQVPAMLTSENSEFYQQLAAAHEESFGRPLRPRFIGGWGDPRLLDCPNTIFWGPGGGGGDHTYDEYYELCDLAPSLRALGRLVLRWCAA